jgi:hypothetical protein
MLHACHRLSAHFAILFFFINMDYYNKGLVRALGLLQSSEYADEGWILI